MYADRGIIFTTEAVVASAIFLASLLFILYSTTNLSSPDFSVQQSMAVAHDLVLNNSDNPPEGYMVNEDVCLSNKGYVAKIEVSPYENWHAEVCMK